MTAFIILYCYLFLVWCFSRNIKDNDKRKEIQCIFSACGLIFLLGLHSPTLGCDVAGAYVPAFERVGTKPIISTDDSIFGFELGYMNYMVLIRQITDDPQWFLFISSLIIVIPIVILFYKYSENVMFSIIIYTSWYLYYFAFSGLRQSIAISICALATIFIFKRKLLFFLIIVYIASRFHTSALFFIFTYPLYNYKVSNRTILIVGLLLLAVLIAAQNVMSVVADLILGADSRYSSQLENSTFAGFTMAIVYFAFAVFQMAISSRGNNKYIVIIMLLTIIQSTGIYSQTIPRLAYYFIPMFAMSFPTALNELKFSVRIKAQTILIVIFISFFMMQANGHYLDVTPFKFFWE